nr:nonstructural polyprotein [Mamastrovirus sp.]
MDLSLQVTDPTFKAQAAATYNGEAARRLRGALKVPYRVTQEQANYVLKVLGVDCVFQQSRVSTHAVLRTLHLFAEDMSKHQHPQLDIGGDPRITKMGMNIHVCMLVDNARDELRYARFLNDTRPSAGSVCINGAENCDVQAGHARCIHAAYDITWPQWETIFERHGLRTVDIWIIEPDELFGGTSDFELGIITKCEGSETIMLLRDGCAGYAHRTAEWVKYRQSSGHWGRQFNLAISPEGSWGPLRRYTMFRCVYPWRIHHVRHVIQQDLLEVPRVGGGTVTCPRNIWNNLLSWAISRNDDKFTYNNCMAYARAMRNRLVIGTSVIQEGWRQDTRAVNEVVMSCFVLAAAMRYMRTSSISEAFKQLKREQERGLLGELLDRLTDYLGCTRIKIKQFLEKDVHSLREQEADAGMIVKHLGARVCASLTVEAEQEDEEPAPPPDMDEAQRAMDAYCVALSAQAAAANKFSEAAAEALVVAEQLKPRTPCLCRRFITGPPGSGKSTDFATWSDEMKAAALVVVPTKKQRADWEQRGFRALTPVKALGVCPSVEHIIVDECGLIHPGCIELLARTPNIAQIIVLGDLRQVTFVDFEGLGDSIDRGKLLADWFVTEKQETHRCPLDVTRVLKRYYRGLRTTSTVSKSIHRGVCNPAAQHIVFTQGHKQLLQSRGLQAYTVHESQGSTFRAVCLHVDERDEPLVRSSTGHCVVAISRHTGSLVLVEERTTCFSEWLANDIELGVVEHALLEVEMPEDNRLVATIADRGGDDRPPNTGAVLDDIGCFGADTGIERVTSCQMPAVKNRVELTVEPAATYDVGRTALTMVAQEPCRQSRPGDRTAALAANLHRVAARNNNVSGREAKMRGSAMARAFTQWLQCSPTALQAEPYLRLAEALETAAKKDPELKKQLEFELTDVPTIRNHLKQQAKYAGNILTKIKAGQGINAWSKQANLMVGPFIRAAQEVCLRCLKPNVCMVVHQSDAELKEWIEGQHNSLLRCYCNDFTEFDSTQSNITCCAETEILRMLGVPKHITEVYKALRSSAVVSAPGHRVRAPYARMSGEANTLFGNTLVTMCVNALMFPGNFRWAAFKGDDSIVAEPERVNAVSAVEETTGMICKLQQEPVPEFVGFLIGDSVVPDLKRMVGKVIGKSFPDAQESRDSLRKSIADRLGLLKHDETTMCLALNCAHHREDSAEVQTWYDALRNTAAQLPPPVRRSCVEVRENTTDVRASYGTSIQLQTDGPEAEETARTEAQAQAGGQGQQGRGPGPPPARA